MEWTREQRYRRLEEADQAEYQDLLNTVSASQYRQTFHIQPISGLLNDPNGFSYFDGEYHLFYQWYPLGPVHGVKYWYHVQSKDLVHWENVGIGMRPDTKYDSHGVFSGTGLPLEDKLLLFYTGNTRTEDWMRIPYQCLAIMDKDGNIEKHSDPLIIDSEEGYTDNYRDPKVFKSGDKYICLIGAETEKHQGRVVYYESEDLKKWKFRGEIQTIKSENEGYMWECPDYFELEGQGVLVISPQGMEVEGDQFNNIFQSGYLIGEPIDFKEGTFKHQAFKEFDRGFEFYAPQTIQTPDGRRILIAWFGLPGVLAGTEEDGWAHCLTIPRELELRDNKLYQNPVQELEALRKHTLVEVAKLNKTSTSMTLPRCYEAKVNFTEIDANKVGIKFRKSAKEEVLFYYNLAERKLVLDRSKTHKVINKEYGDKRKCNFSGNELRLHLFLDESSVEIFVNDGQEVFSSRIYNKPGSNDFEIFVENGHAFIEYSLWEL